MAWTGSMWWLPTIDGILPIGDIIYLGGIGVTAAIDSIGIDNIARFFDEVPNAFQQLIQQAGDIAIYHCSIKIVSRGKGKSAVAAAAYRAGEKLTNEWDGPQTS